MAYGILHCFALLLSFTPMIISLWDPSAVKNLFINSHLPGMESLDPNSPLNGLSVEDPLTCSAFKCTHYLTIMCFPKLNYRVETWQIPRTLHGKINSQKVLVQKCCHTSFLIISFSVQFAQNCHFKQKLLNNRSLTVPSTYLSNKALPRHRSQWMRPHQPDI